MNKEVYILRDDGVEMITYALELKATVGALADSWKEFCALPQEYKQLFATNNTQNGVGYELKTGDGLHDDRKENFDYAWSGDVFDRIFQESPNDTAERFVVLLRQLNGAMQEMIHSYGKRAGLPTEGARAFFRCLHYPSGTREGELIAEPHTDHSGFTFHLYETTSGCERLDFDGNWQPLPVTDSETVVFGGMQSQLVTKGEIKALCHRVVANKTSQEAGRLAIVCFVALPNVPKYNKASHGRLQEMTPGFNYSMAHEAFKKLFL